MPMNIVEVGRRMKDIQHSSPTRTITDIVRGTQNILGLINRLLEHIPTESLTEEEIAMLGKWSCDSAITLVHLIYRHKNHELASKDYEVSRLSVEEYWQAGGQADRILNICFLKSLGLIVNSSREKLPSLILMKCMILLWYK